jgi:hypothetical protein
VGELQKNCTVGWCLTVASIPNINIAPHYIFLEALLPPTNVSWSLGKNMFQLLGSTRCIYVVVQVQAKSDNVTQSSLAGDKYRGLPQENESRAVTGRYMARGILSDDR